MTLSYTGKGTTMSDGSMPIAYVLTIDPVDGLRRKHAGKELADIGLEGKFVEGFRKDDPALSNLYSPALNLLFAKRSMTSGEIAVYAGHRKIWQAIVDSGMAYALVFEDDFRVLDGTRFKATLRDCLPALAGWDIVKFFDFRPKRVIRCRRVGATDLVAYKYPAPGAVAYLISRDAARRLLARRRIFRPVDVDFSWPWEFGLRIWSILPNLVDEVSHNLGGSHLEATRLANRARRTIWRGLWADVLQAWKLVCAYIYAVRIGWDYEAHDFMPRSVTSENNSL